VESFITLVGRAHGPTTGSGSSSRPGRIPDLPAATIALDGLDRLEAVACSPSCPPGDRPTDREAVIDALGPPR